MRVNVLGDLQVETTDRPSNRAGIVATVATIPAQIAFRDGSRPDGGAHLDQGLRQRARAASRGSITAHSRPAAEMRSATGEWPVAPSATVAAR
jgi:hypothetical protein